MNKNKENQTEHFIFRTDWIQFFSYDFQLFRALNKTTGDQATVKYAKKKGGDLPKEAELLAELEHENIVKMLGLEKINNKVPVLVFEYLDGSDMNFTMSQPKHLKGLPETEILQLLHDLVAMKEYLKEKNIVHGNMQGSNIYRFKKDNGKVLFKLTGFDDAHRADSPGFISALMSVVSPQSARPVLNHLFGVTKGEEKIDLFHSGMILYIAIAGAKPFRDKGFNDQTLIQEILHGKPPGAISGVVLPTGRIEYSKELPETCVINRNLCKLIEPILSGMLEKDFGDIISCEEYFEKAKVVLSQKPIYVFLFNEGRNITVYVKADENSKNIMQTISEMTGVPLDKHLYYFKKDNSHFFYKDGRWAEGLPLPWESSLDDPVILLDLREKMCEKLIKLGYSPFQQILRSIFFSLSRSSDWQPGVDTSLVDSICKCFKYFEASSPLCRGDFWSAKDLCTLAHSIKGMISIFSQQIVNVLYTLDYFTKYLQQQSDEMKTRTTVLRRKICMEKEQLKQCKSSFSVILNMKTSLNKTEDDIIDVDDFFESSDLLDKCFSQEAGIFAEIHLNFTNFDKETVKLKNIVLDPSSAKIDWFSKASAIVNALDELLLEFKISLQKAIEGSEECCDDKAIRMCLLIQKKQFNSLMKDLLDIVATAEQTCHALYQNKIDDIYSLFRAIRFHQECEEVIMAEEDGIAFYKHQIMKLGHIAYKEMGDLSLQVNNPTDDENAVPNNQMELPVAFSEKVSAVQVSQSNMQSSLDEQKALMERLKTSQQKLEELLLRAEHV